MLGLLCCMLSASARNTKGWSLIPYVKSGSALDFLYAPYEVRFRGEVGVDAKYSFNKHWSLLAGIEYEFRTDNSDNPDYMAKLGSGYHHYFRIPMRIEFSHKWFYLNSGSFIERATNPWLYEDSHEDIGFGMVSEIGGRIRLSENNRLRLGLQNQLGQDRITYHNDFGEKERWTCISFLNFLLSVGYEHHF